MPAFRYLDRRMSRDVRQLHDFLWVPGWKGNTATLRDNLLKEAKELDAHLRAGGRLRRNAEALARRWNRGDEGASLFELLSHTYHLTAATERSRRRDYAGAGEHVAWVVESVSIGVCASAGSFQLVEDWEGGRTDFETYTSRLADALQARGVDRAGDFKRILIAARNFGRSGDDGSTNAERALAARAAIANAAWCALVSVSIRGTMGAAPKFKVDDFASILDRIASRI